MIRRPLIAIIFVAGASCASGTSIVFDSVRDVSKTQDSLYPACANEKYVDSSRDLENYLENSDSISAEQWTKIDNFPCQKLFSYTEDSVRKTVTINLSGVGIFESGAGISYLYCGVKCKREAGWSQEDQ